MLKNKKVTFILPAEIVANASNGLLLGEFNNWDKETGFSLKKSKDGSMKATIELEAGKSYEYRYLLDGGRWENDQTADQYAHVHGFNIVNCVITVPVEETLVEVKPKTKKAAVVKAEKKEKVPAENAPAKKVKSAPVVKKVADDLTKIEGIGKKIAELLKAESISSFSDLSKATPKKLKAILDAAGNKFSMHEPATWPKQAKLAASEKWEELKKLQSDLKGGK
jgi:predicted flap endonuclease-1-like 5' DNA nuclease